jgi:4-amino-4-deoxychorismate lyase
MSTWFEDGTAVATVPIEDRALQYGDGLFETIAVRDGKLRLFDLHIARLRRGCDVLRLDMPDAHQLQREAELAITHTGNETSDCIVKILVSAAGGRRGYGRASTQSNVRLGVYQSRPCEADAYDLGVNAVLCETRLAVSSATAGLKTVARLEQVMGRSECLRSQAFEGLMLDADGRLICGTMSNVFIVSENALLTPYLGRCGVAGVMREFAIDVFQKHGIDVSIRDIAVEELWQSDEVFVTNSQFGALPLRSCGQRNFRQGDMSRRCFALLARHGIVECLR